MKIKTTEKGSPKLQVNLWHSQAIHAVNTQGTLPISCLTTLKDHTNSNPIS